MFYEVVGFLFLFGMNLYVVINGIRIFMFYTEFGLTNIVWLILAILALSSLVFLVLNSPFTINLIRVSG